MSGQNSYGYAAPRGVAGGLFDVSPYRIDSRVNGEKQAGAMKFGMGAVQGDSPGTNVALPDDGAEEGGFEGLVMTGHTTEMDVEGKVVIAPLQTVGVLRWGKAWALVASGAEPAYGDYLYLVTEEGADRGKFTNDEDGGLAVNGRFVGGAVSGDLAPVEIFNQKS